MRRIWSLFAGAALLAGGGPVGAAPRVQSWMTTADGTARLTHQPVRRFERGSVPAEAIMVDPRARYQSIVGFGAAMTDASADLIATALTPARRRALMRELFGHKQGIGIGFVRLTIGASDFSPTHYSFDDRPKGEVDPELRHFSIAPAERYMLPLVRAARAANPALAVMATPWSPPGWMKTTDSLIGGTLRDDMAAPFAHYLTRTVQGFGQAGVKLDYLTIQNEPDFEPADYPGMRLSAAQRARLIGGFVAPALARVGVSTRLLEWDHNWDKPEQPLEFLADPRARAGVAGVAWHCYAGDVGAQAMVHARFPESETFFTECSGGEWARAWPETWPWMMHTLAIGATRQWARGVLLWNLALDEHYGAHRGGCGNCRGVVTIDRRTGAITRNPEYYVLGHLGRFVRRGAVRIGSPAAQGPVESVAFQNPDGGIVLLVYNAGEARADFAIAQAGCGALRYALPAHAAATLTWRACR